ncbi:hypothetical protein HS125_07895 [bacterium]|nr:hypothetical protein [bacterium]
MEYEYDETYGYLTALRNKSATGEEFASFEYTYDLDGLVERVDLEDGSYIPHDYHTVI